MENNANMETRVGYMAVSMLKDFIEEHDKFNRNCAYRTNK